MYAIRSYYGCFRSRLHLTAFPRCGLDDRLVLLGGVQPRLEFGELGNSLNPAGFEFVALGLQAAPLLLGGAHLLAESAELLIDP